MGSAPSKAVRKLPKEQPSWTGSRIPSAATTESARPRSVKGPLAFESRNEAIERDAKDLHFTEKLNRLGPVQVDHGTQTVQTHVASDIRHMYRSRIRSEAEAADLQSTVNHVLVSSLTELLEARKSVTSGAELEALAQRYHVDAATLQRLGQVVNTPSIDESTVIRIADERGQKSSTMMARWVDPVLSRSQ